MGVLWPFGAKKDVDTGARPGRFATTDKEGEETGHHERELKRLLDYLFERQSAVPEAQAVGSSP